MTEFSVGHLTGPDTFRAPGTDRSATQSRYTGPMLVRWVGVSSQRTADGDPIAALCNTTPTGQLVELIVSLCPPGISHRKLNFIDRVLEDAAGKLRPPTVLELSKSLPRILGMIRRNKNDFFVFLGSHIRGCLREAFPESRFEYYQVQRLADSARGVVVHHPSYIRVYRHKHMDEYARRVANLIAEMAP